jgi:hypothetical protein
MGALECPACRLTNPEGTRVCDCGYSFLSGETRHRQIFFNSSVAETVRMLLPMVGWSLLVVTVARGFVRWYEWMAQGVRLSDGTSARFEGRASAVWLSALWSVSVAQFDRHLGTRLISSFPRRSPETACGLCASLSLGAHASGGNNTSSSLGCDGNQTQFRLTSDLSWKPEGLLRLVASYVPIGIISDADTGT